MTRPRLTLLVATASLVGLAVALPALAQRHVTRTTVAVIAGRPSIFKFTLSKKTVPHGVVTFKVTNKGVLAHDFKVCASSKGGNANACVGKATRLIAPGRSATLVVTFTKKGTYEYLCTVAGHAAGGMKGTLKVT